MNPKFLKLAQQAGLKFASETELSPQEQKFAELIVRECAGIVNSLDQYEGEGDSTAVEYMKEYFGVK